MTQPEQQPQQRQRRVPADTYVCNVQTWGAAPQYSEGQMIPADCPYDVDAAVASGKVVTVEEYQKAHPEWDPKAAAEAEKAAAEKAKAYPGYAASEIPLTPEEAEAQAEAKTKADAEAVEPTPAQTVETAKADDAPKATPVQAPAPPSRPTGGQAHR